MTRKKKENTPGDNLAKQIIEQHNPKSVEDMQNALKDIFGPMFEAMLQGEMNDHLGYESNDHGSKSTDNRRNGYINKKIKTSSGEVDIKVPRDRDASFEPKLVPKRKKDILGLWLNESESKHTWMQIFDELKARGVEDVLFISMDGVSGLEEGAKAIFKDVVVQRCMVHLIRNSIKYVPSKDYKKFTQSLKKVYGAPSLNACKKAFEQFCQEWSQYPGAVDVWKRNFSHVEQLFDYGSSVRRVMYTTNAVESINSSFRKVTKKGAFPSENALLKVLYLRITELYKKWNGSKVQNWAMVRNQLVTNDKIKARIEKYEHMI